MAVIATFMNNSRIHSYVTRYLTGYFSYFLFTILLYYADLISVKYKKTTVGSIIFAPYLTLSLYAIISGPTLHFPYNYPATTFIVGFAILSAFWLIAKQYFSFFGTFTTILICSVYTASWIVPDYLLRKGDKEVRTAIMPTFSNIFTDTAGNKITNSFFQNRVVVLDFWFKGCKPCYDKMPVLERIATKYRMNKNVAILAVNIGIQDSFEEFKSDPIVHLFEVPEFYLLDTSLLRILEFEGYPSEIILSREGAIVKKHSGFDKSLVDVYYKSRLKIIDSLLNQKK